MSDDVIPTPARPTRQKNLTRALAQYIRHHMRKQGTYLDEFDADFLLAIVMEWLEANNAAVTPSGVRRFKTSWRKRKGTNPIV